MTSLDLRHPAASRAASLAAVEAAPSRRSDAVAGIVTAVVCVLLGAPVGLLWVAVAPKVVVEVSGTAVRLASDTSTFIAGDGAFLGVVFVAGLLTGLLAWALGRRHGPAVVAGLTVGGLIGAYVAARTGELVDEGSARAAVEVGRMGGLELSLVLRATEAVVGWPIGALLGFLAPFSLWPDRRDDAGR